MFVRYFFIALFAMLVIGCTNQPAATTPTGRTVFAVLVPGGGWVNVGPTNGAYEILPSALPSGGFQVGFDTIYPAKLRVKLDGLDLPKFDEIATGTDPKVTGFYRIIETNINLTPAKWRIAVRPPNSLLGLSAHTLLVSSISVNPSYPAGDARHESVPLDFALTTQRIYFLAVGNIGDGRGIVRSQPVNGSTVQIDCGNTCVANFGQSVSVELRATALNNSTFDGWQGACVGTGPCIVTLNGTAAAVFAKFSKATGSSVDVCPMPIEVPGFTFSDQPGCATTVADEHPSAALGCDAQGFYCCESVVGTSSARCGPEKHEFPPDCIHLGNLNTVMLVQPYGCYVRDLSP